MSNFTLNDIINGIKPINKELGKNVSSRLDMLAKPPGSLGELEAIAIRLAEVQATELPVVDKRCVIVSAADNGVVAEGVASAPQSVTAIQTMNIIKGVTGVGVLAKQFNADLVVADLGVDADLSNPMLLDRKIRRSTGNICKEEAMTRAEAIRAIETGIELACIAKEQSYNVIGIGEMGIGNTTTSSAVLSALLGLTSDEVEKTIGRGAGLDDTAFQHKIDVVVSSLIRHQPDRNDPIDILHKVGGLDIACMTGVYLGAAYYGLPVVIDGFISVVAALCAARINPLTQGYMFASHHSFERGYALAIAELALTPSLNLGMRLGEGSGCPIMFAIMDAALAVLKNMATFGEADIDSDYVDNIKDITF